MAKSDFEATWYPRIGKDAAEELRRFRKIVVMFALPAPLAGGVAGILIGTGTVNDVIGGILAVAAAGYIVMFINAQRKIAAALSDWFGVKITGGQLPKMNPKRFDAWCQERGLHHEDRRVGSGQATQSS